MGKPIANPSVPNFLEVLKDDNRFVIPNYQREYTWRNEDKWRLVETIVHDINEGRKLTFLGGVILSQGEKARNDTPYDIVDGQQRTITVIFILYCLYKIIEVVLKNENYKSDISLLGKHLELMKHLKKRCSKLERADEQVEAGRPEKHMTYILMNLPKDAEEKTYPHISLTDLKTIKEEEDFLIKVLQQVLNLHSFEFEHSKKFDDMTQEEDRKSLVLEKASPSTPAQNILQFCDYFLDKVQFIQTIVQEEYAYDVFERFNTAGDPLTAFETFKPLVMSDLTNEKISRSYKSKILQIEENLKRWSYDSNNTKKRNKTNKNTENFVIWFAYYFSGGKSKSLKRDRRPVEKSLHAQREYLRGMYQKRTIKKHSNNEKQHIKTDDKKNKQKMLECMWHMSEFIDKAWRPSDLDFSNFEPQGKSTDYRQMMGEAAFSLDFLRASKHVICIPLIVYYFEKFQNNKTVENLKNFCDVIKICASFFCLWRSSRSTTGSIDERYRNIYFGDSQLQGFKDFEAIYKNRDQWSVEVLKKYFRQNLQEHREYGVTSSQQWAERMTDSRAGKLTHVSKFILLLSAHDTRFNHLSSDSSTTASPNRHKGRFVLYRKKGLNYILNDDSWSSNDYKTVEHIVPMKRGTKDLEDQKKQLRVTNNDECLSCINSIGNLALIPKGLNSKLKDGLLASKVNIFLKNDADKNEPYLFSLEFLKHIEVKDFDHKYIEGRSQELARCAWEILAVHWLGWKNENK